MVEKYGKRGKESATAQSPKEGSSSAQKSEEDESTPVQKLVTALDQVNKYNEEVTKLSAPYEKIMDRMRQLTTTLDARILKFNIHIETMQVAEVLSDLTSLRACGHKEALALVNVHKTPGQPQSPADEGKHAELSRAKELVDLHYGLKVRHMGRPPSYEPAVDEDLRHAREEVNRVLREVNVA